MVILPAFVALSQQPQHNMVGDGGEGPGAGLSVECRFQENFSPPPPANESFEARDKGKAARVENIN